jgi:hypothetical protein
MYGHSNQESDDAPVGCWVILYTLLFRNCFGMVTETRWSGARLITGYTLYLEIIKEITDVQQKIRTEYDRMPILNVIQYVNRG